MRLEPSSTGTPNRVIVGYKSSTLDPITAGSLKTDQFRLLSPPRPEQTLVGVQYVNENDGLPPNLPPFIATNTSHWIYDNTGLTVGSQVPHLIGYEVDQLFPTYQAPTSLSYTTLGDSLLPVGTSSVHANASIYQAPRGSWVFASGTMSWSWALGRAGYENAGIQQMMRNLFTRFGVVSNPNTPPSVTLTSPANGAGFTAPATVALAATASDSGGSITKVEFYNGATLLGSDTTSPYTFTWSNVPQGSYTLTARAYDNGGLTTTSTSVGIAVAAQPTNTPPSVALTSPADGASFRDRSTITLSAAATDTDGTIAKVEFYNGSTRLQTDSQGPYTYDWRGVRRGTYTLTARAYDSGGLSTTSAPVVITVTR